MVVHRLRGSGKALFRTVRPSTLTGGCGGGEGITLASLRRKASNTCSAVQDTFLSTKAVFENHRVVFTVGTSILSVLTAWAGYSIRHLHQTKVEKRLEAIEQSLKNSYDMEHEEIKKIVSSGNVSMPACIATAWTTLVIGYALGWRGGAWYTNRKFRREQLKLMGQIKPHNRWQFLQRPLIVKPLTRLRGTRSTHKKTEAPAMSNPNLQPVQK